MPTHIRPLLLVEDHELAAHSVVRQLGLCRPAHLRGPVHVARTVAEARQALASNMEFAGVLIDHGLPDGKGFDVVETIRQRSPAPPILILTGTDDPEVINRSHALGLMYVRKPGDKENYLVFLARVDHAEQHRAGTTTSEQALAACLPGKA